MQRRLFLTVLAALAACVPSNKQDGGELEPAVTLGSGGPPDLVQGPNGPVVVFSANVVGDSGRDVFYCEDPLAAAGPRCVRLNRTPGEALDNGEDSPVLRAAPDGSLFAVWIARDDRHKLANSVRFSRRPPGTDDWEEPRTLNDDADPATHDFPNAVIGPDGSLHVFWIDRREVPKGAFAPYPTGGVAGPEPLLPGTAAIYSATSRDGGRTFEPNRRVAGDVCACCRPTAVVVADALLLAYRSVSDTSVRNIVVVSSDNGGRSWSNPRIVSNDGWKLNACPHSGPSAAVSDDGLWIAWMDGSDGSSKVYVSRSEDGVDFAPRRLLSTECIAADHPDATTANGRLIVAYECTAEQESFASYRRRPDPSETAQAPLLLVPNAARPRVLATPDGFVAGWVEGDRTHVARWVAESARGGNR